MGCDKIGQIFPFSIASHFREIGRNKSIRSHRHMQLYMWMFACQISPKLWPIFKYAKRFNIHWIYAVYDVRCTFIRDFFSWQIIRIHFLVGLVKLWCLSGNDVHIMIIAENIPTEIGQTLHSCLMDNVNLQLFLELIIWLWILRFDRSSGPVNWTQLHLKYFPIFIRVIQYRVCARFSLISARA